MDAPQPETLEQLRAENQRLRARIATLEAHGEPAPLIAGAAPYGQPIWFDAVSDAILVVDTACHIQQWNHAAERIYGWPRAEAVGRTLAELLPPLAPRLEPIMRQVLTTGAAVRDMEVRGQMWPKDGAAHDWLISYFPVAGPAGAVIGVGVIVTDITQSTQAAAALQASTAKLVAAFESMTDAIFISDTDGRFIDFNDAFVTFHKFRTKDECATTLAEYSAFLDVFLPTGALAPLEQWAVPRALRGETATNAEYTLRRKDTGETWVGSYSFAPIRGQGGAIIGSVVVGRDITAHKHAELALRESEMRYRILFEFMDQGVVYHNADGQIIDANFAAERILGLSLSELQGRTSHDPRWHPIHEDGAPFPGADHPVMLALRTGQEVRDTVMGVYRPVDDDYRWIRIQAVPLSRSGEARPSQVYTIFDDITDRRQAALLRAEERQQLEAILQTMGEGVLAFRPNGAIVVLNAMGRRLVGLDPHAPITTLAEVITQSPVVAFDRDGQPLRPERAPIRRVLQGERLSNLEVRTRTAGDPDDRWLAFSGTPVFGPDGAITLAVLTARDITQRKRDELALQMAFAQTAAHVARLDSLLAHVPVGISLLDTELRFQHVNAHLAAMNGLPIAAHLGRPIGAVLPAIAAELEAIYRQVLTTGEPLLGIEVVGETPAAPGEPRTWQASYFPVRSATGALLGAGAVISDITEQRRAEQALQIEHQQMVAILEALDEGVIVLRPDGSIVVVNRAARQIIIADSTDVPATAQELISMSSMELRDAAGQPIAPAAWPLMRVLRDERFRNWDLHLRTPGSPEEQWATFSGMTLAAAGGAPALGVVTRSDITQRKRAEAALQAHAEALSRTNAELTRALRLKDEFLAMMSHELRTPLTVILGVCEAMEMELYGPIAARQRQALATVMQSGRQLLAILSDILDLAHIEAGQTTLDPQPIDVRPALPSRPSSWCRPPPSRRAIDLQHRVAPGVAGLSRRRAPADPDPGQPARQRDQVHPGRAGRSAWR